MNLNWNDIDHFTSYTCQRMNLLNNEIEGVYKKYKRLYEFGLYLVSELRKRGEITEEEFDQIEAMVNHCPEKTVHEIFQEVFSSRFTDVDKN